VLERTLYAIFRRVDFRGKGRLRRILPVREHGSAVIDVGGARLRLDLRESLQRDFLFGLYDRAELELLRSGLHDGDFVDVGAHIGMYSLAGALATPGRVLALEPHPVARAQLVENVRLNGLTNVVVVAKAAAAKPGRAQLHVPATPDPSFSSLGAGRFSEGEPVDVQLTTVDAEVEAHALRPTFVKIDVEGGELDVVAGMARTIAEYRPTLLVEVNEESARELERRLDGYSGRVARSLEPLESGRGLFNALFVPQPPVPPL
jgi:FkbM family methyltransferase